MDLAYATPILWISFIYYTPELVSDTYPIRIHVRFSDTPRGVSDRYGSNVFLIWF